MAFHDRYDDEDDEPSWIEQITIIAILLMVCAVISAGAVLVVLGLDQSIALVGLLWESL